MKTGFEHGTLETAFGTAYFLREAFGALTAGGARLVAIEGPEIDDLVQAVRAVFAPVPGDDPGAVRRLVANVQIMRIQKRADGPALLDPPIVVPIERCNFEPRGFVPYTGGRWYWNCAPQMFPIAERWRQAGQR